MSRDITSLNTEKLRMKSINLLRPARNLARYTLLSADGQIGSVDDFYFDDTTWLIRYLIVNTGGWLMGRRVLLASRAIGNVDDGEKTIAVELTREQIENSPPMETRKPVSRQYEIEFYEYYGWSPYWEADPLSGFAMHGSPVASFPNLSEKSDAPPEESKLRRTSEVEGYDIEALDGEIGHVKDFIVDADQWVIRYLQIDTGKWLPGRHVLVSPGWIKGVSWKDRAVSVDLGRKVIESAPGHDPSEIIDRDYEVRLFKHYGRAVYWG